MKLTDALLGEHGAFYALFDNVEELAASAGRVAQIQGAITVLETMILWHATLEEQLLFTALAPHLEKGSDLIATLNAEHKEMEVLLGRIEDAEGVHDATRWVERALSSARSHFKKEEEVIFPLAQKFLSDETLERLGLEWAAARKVTIT